jgi:hypothetical protein
MGTTRPTDDEGWCRSPHCTQEELHKAGTCGKVLCPQCKGTQLQPEHLRNPGERRKWCKRCGGKGYCKPMSPLWAKVMKP